jgi:peptidoglycan hydrolase-like protein with peptidoglycan-binding domain
VTPTGVGSVRVTESAVDEGRGYDRLRRRRILLLAIVGIVVVAVAGAFLLTTEIKSPAQQAADTKPPALTLLTSVVQRTVLTNTVLAQAVVGPPPEFSPTIIGGSAGSAAAASENVQQIVTKTLTTQGSVVSQGTVLFEVAGQPFFLLQGTVPAYRDLEEGETGQDIVQLQDDLESLGYSVGSDTSGVFGPGTASAVKAYYEAIGYAVPYTTPQIAPSGKAGSKAHGSPMIPLGQYTFVPQLPARIIKLGAKVGQAVGGVTLAIGNPSVSGQLSPSDRNQVRPGMRVTITEPGTGVTVPGRVTSVANSTATTASISGGLFVPMGIEPDRALPMSMIGQDVSLTIAAASSSGPVLAVPVAAIYASANGGTYVTKLVGTSQVKVPVMIGMSGSGLVQVTPLQAGGLGAGDIVVTGADYSTGSQVVTGRVPGSGG